MVIYITTRGRCGSVRERRQSERFSCVLVAGKSVYRLGEGSQFGVPRKDKNKSGTCGGLVEASADERLR